MIFIAIHSLHFVQDYKHVEVIKYVIMYREIDD